MLAPLIINTRPYSGVLIELLNLYVEKQHTCYEIKVEETSSFSGMIDTVQRHEADIGLGPFGYSVDRIAKVDFSEPYLHTDYNILYPRPKLEPDIVGFIKPFSFEVWVTILVAFLVATLLTWVFIRKSSPYNPTTENKETSAYFLWCYHILLNQSFPSHPARISSRLFAAIWMLFAIILALSYKSNLIAHLTFPKVNIPFDSIEELVQQDTVKWKFAKNSLIHSLTKAALDEGHNGTAAAICGGAGNLLQHPSEIIPSVIGNRTAAILLRYNNLYDLSSDFTKVEKCRMALSKGGIIAVPFASVLPKRSPLLASYNNLIVRLKESGIMAKFLNDPLTRGQHCFLAPGSEKEINLRSLSLVDFQGIFALYTVGIFLSTLAFLGELFARFGKF